MHKAPDNRTAPTPEQKVRALFERTSLPEKLWIDLAHNRDAAMKISLVLDQIAALPQAQRPSSAPFTLGRHVINVRPLVIPVLVAAVVKVAVFVSPNLESEILPWLDVVAVLERINKIYQHLDDDEVDVFGAVAGLSNVSDVSPSVTDPERFPSVEGIQSWFRFQGYLPPANLEVILQSLERKGAIREREGLYRPFFWGKSD